MTTNYDYHRSKLGEQVLNGVFTAFWLVFWPFMQVFRFLRWFLKEVTKEVGIRMVKYTAWMIFAIIIGFIYKYLN